jgi:hypothetical protein
MFLPILVSFLSAAQSPTALSEDFEGGLCVSPCRGAAWAFAQEVEGKLDLVAAGPKGNVLRARTGPRRDRVPKAALVARPAKAGPGAHVSVGFDLLIPEGAPLNSVHLVDIECATCGEEGNPGIRLYLRNGRLRIDRAKIGVRHAWTDGAAPMLVAGRWHRIALDVLLGDADGSARVRLDGETVLRGEGATILEAKRGFDAGADRVQIGITASSNSVPAEAYFDGIRIEVTR